MKERRSRNYWLKIPSCRLKAERRNSLRLPRLRMAHLSPEFNTCSKDKTHSCSKEATTARMMMKTWCRCRNSTLMISMSKRSRKNLRELKSNPSSPKVSAKIKMTCTRPIKKRKTTAWVLMMIHRPQKPRSARWARTTVRMSKHRMMTRRRRVRGGPAQSTPSNLPSVKVSTSERTPSW